jgi:hypothetical protein
VISLKVTRLRKHSLILSTGRAPAALGASESPSQLHIAMENPIRNSRVDQGKKYSKEIRGRPNEARQRNSLTLDWLGGAPFDLGDEWTLEAPGCPTLSRSVRN